MAKRKLADAAGSSKPSKSASAASNGHGGQPRADKSQAKADSGHAEIGQPSSTLRIVVGTYEHLLHGFDLHLRQHPAASAASATKSSGTASHTAVDGKTTEAKTGAASVVGKWTPIFLQEAHTASVRCLAAGGRYLVSGGADEVVKVSDLRRRRDLGALVQHAGTVTALAFSPTAKHLVSADERDRLIVWSAGDWTALVETKMAHGARGCTALDVHPTGKVALSTGGDANVRLWNLVTGKKAAKHAFLPAQAARKQNGKQQPAAGREVEPIALKWHPDGAKYAVLSETQLAVFEAGQAVARYEVAERRERMLCMVYTRDGTLLVGCEDGAIRKYDPASNTMQIVARHKQRVKAITTAAVTPVSSDGGSVQQQQQQRQQREAIVSASSDGMLKVWLYPSTSTSAADTKGEKVDGERMQCVAERDLAGARVTCVVATDAAVEDTEAVVKRRKDDRTAARAGLGTAADASNGIEQIDVGVKSEPEEEFAGFD